MTDPRYPIGKFAPPAEYTADLRASFVREIAAAPAALTAAVIGLTTEQRLTPYRDGGWTTRQIVHHLADSHTNAFIRVKLGVTEDNPTIKPYDEATWAKTTDSRETPIALSLSILEGLHARWSHLMRSLDASAYDRMVLHPVGC